MARGLKAPGGATFMTILGLGAGLALFLVVQGFVPAISNLTGRTVPTAGGGAAAT